jgi:hypothetical protein
MFVGFKAGISGGYSGGTYGRLFNASTLVPIGPGVMQVNAIGGNEEQAVVYQKHTGMFLTAWLRVPDGWIDTRLVVPDGTMGQKRTALGPNGGNVTLAYNEFTQTTLVTTKDSSAILYALELGNDGTPIRPENLLILTTWDGAINDYLPAMGVNEEDGQWLVAYRMAASSQGQFITGTYVDPTSVPLTIQTPSFLPPGTHTVPYAQLMLASGGVIPYTWQLVSGALPPGVNLVGPYLSGTPTAPGSYNFRLRVTSTDAQVAERDFGVTIQAIISVPPGGAGAHIEGQNPLYLSFSHANRNNLAYDSVNGVYLMTVNNPDAGVPITGRFLDRNGTAFGTDFTIADDIDPATGSIGFLAWSGITFGGPANDPTFLITYHLADAAQVNSLKFARFVRFNPFGPPTVSGSILITPIGAEWFASEKAQSFWNGTHWIIGTRLLPPGFVFPTFVVQALTMGGALTPVQNLGDGGDFYGSPAITCAANGICIAIGFKAGIPTGYTGGTYARLFNGFSLAPTAAQFSLAESAQNEDQGVVYQTHTGNFLAQWWSSTGGGYILTRLIGTDGSMSILNPGIGIGPNSGANAIAFNQGTRTSLLVTKRVNALGAIDLAVMELGDDGSALNPGNAIVVVPWDGSINDFYPSIAANNGDLQWLVTARLASGTHGRIIQGSVPNTPIPIQNGSFASGMTGWSLFAVPSGDLAAGVAGGVLHFYRQPLPPGQTGQGVILQTFPQPIGAGQPVTADFSLGNNSSVRKRISILLHDLDFSDLQVCTFWLEPNTPLRPYAMRTHTNEAWTQPTIAFYAATTGSDGGAYLLDDVRVYQVVGQPVDRTQCVDPTAPAAEQIEDSGNAIANGSFSTGTLASWGTFGQITAQVAGGVVQLARPAGTPAGVLQQSPGWALSIGRIPLTATFSLGNSSSVRKRATVLIHDLDFSDLAACTFWLEPGQPLANYTMHMFTTKAWASVTLSFYPSLGDDQWILLDDVVLKYTPSTPRVGTECIEPPPGSGPQGLTAAQSGSSRSASAPAATRTYRQGGGDVAGPVWQAVVTEAGAQAFLVATPYDLREAAAPVLRFDSRLSDGASDAFVEVTRDGVNWMRVSAVPPSDDWTSVTVDLSAFAGDVIYVRYVYSGVEPVGGRAIESWAIRAIHIDLRVPRTIQRSR